MTSYTVFTDAAHDVRLVFNPGGAGLFGLMIGDRFWAATDYDQIARILAEEIGMRLDPGAAGEALRLVPLPAEDTSPPV